MMEDIADVFLGGCLAVRWYLTSSSVKKRPKYLEGYEKRMLRCMDLENCCVGENFPSLVQDRCWNFRAVRQSKGAKN